MWLKWILAVSILLPLISRMSTEAAGISGGLTPMEFQHQAILDQYGKFIMLWTPLQKDIIIEIQVATTGFIGIGFSPSGGMKGADIVLAWVDDQTGKLNVHDRFAHGMTIPVIDDSQDIDVLGGNQNDTHTILRFSRPWNTCDAVHDFKISGDTTRVIWAYSKEDPAGDMDMSIHDHRGTKSIYLQEPRFKLPTFSEDVKYVDYLNSAVRLPDDLDTLYWCDVFKIPDISKKHHLIGYVPIIQEGNHEHVHHFLLQECHLNESSVHFEQWLRAGGRQCLVPNMPPSWMFCYHTIFAWAVGSEGVLLSDHVGLPMGEDYGGANYYVLQVHYDNPKLKKGVVDSSGLRIFYTDQLREIDAGVIMVGSSVSPNMLIPPGQEWTTVGICSGDCTEKSFPKDGIRVFQGLLHSHLLGHSITIRQIRNGRELPIVFQDMNYDFNYQQERILKEEMLILPGDTLIMECGYDSTKRTKPTFGGEGTEQEMCLSYLTYYPRIDISNCLSSPQLPTIYEPLDVQDVYYKDERTMKRFSGRGLSSGSVKSIDVNLIKRMDKQLLENPDADIKNVDFSLVFKKVMLKHPQEFENITLYDFLHDDNTWKNPKIVAALQEYMRYQPQLVECENVKTQPVEGVNGIVKYPDFLTFKSLEDDECASPQQSEVYETYGGDEVSMTKSQSDPSTNPEAEGGLEDPLATAGSCSVLSAPFMITFIYSFYGAAFVM